MGGHRHLSDLASQNQDKSEKSGQMRTLALSIIMYNWVGVGRGRKGYGSANSLPLNLAHRRPKSRKIVNKKVPEAKWQRGVSGVVFGGQFSSRQFFKKKRRKEEKPIS
jgi:hypothetical protein